MLRNSARTLQHELDSVAKDISEKVITGRVYLAERFIVKVYDDILKELQLIVKDSFAEMIRVFQTTDFKYELIERGFSEVASEIETELGGHLDKNGKYKGSKNIVYLVFKSKIDGSDEIYDVLFERVRDIFDYFGQEDYWGFDESDMEPTRFMLRLIVDYPLKSGTLLHKKLENEIIKSFVK